MTKPTHAAPRASTRPAPRPAAAKARRKPAITAIETDADVANGLRRLRRACPTIRLMHAVAGVPPLRRRPPGFEGLARIVVGQQLSVASAAAIWNRFAEAVPEMNAHAVLAATDEHLRGAGLSRPKVKTLRAMSAAVADGLDLQGLQAASDEEVHAALTQISGIGPWTADIFMMFCLGRPDAFAPGDLALQIAAQYALEREERLTPDELLEVAERWRPWRSVGARLLWSYYAAIKDARSGQPA